MNYYKAIKKELLDNELYKKIKDYSKNKYELEKYYNVGKLLIEAQGGEERAKYGDGLIKEYSRCLISDVNKKYNERTLRRMRQFYLVFKNDIWSPMATKLSWSHYCELLAIKEKDKIYYYINITIMYNLSKRELREKIKNKEYERLDESTKEKLIKEEENTISDFIKHPIIIKNKYHTIDISEEMLKKMILENIEDFLTELGEDFTFIKSEYKIKLDNRYNYIDILLFNIEYNCYVVVELKVTELKKEHIGQIEFYMNYIDNYIKKDKQDKTVGIIIAKKDNKFVMEYCSNKKIFNTRYELI